MKDPKLFHATYYDSSAEARLTNYADTIVLDDAGKDGKILCAIRFGGFLCAHIGRAVTAEKCVVKLK